MSYHRSLACPIKIGSAAIKLCGTNLDDLLTVQTYAVVRLLKRPGLTLQVFDYYEIREAFVGQALRAEWGQRGLKDVLLDSVKLYEAPRALAADERPTE